MNSRAFGVSLALSLSLIIPLGCDKDEDPGSDAFGTSTSGAEWPGASDGGQGPANDEGNADGGASSQGGMGDSGMGEGEADSAADSNGEGEMNDSQNEGDMPDSDGGMTGSDPSTGGGEEGSSGDPNTGGEAEGVGEEGDPVPDPEPDPDAGPCDAYPDPGLRVRPAVGQPAPHYMSTDSHGESFNMCEFAGEKPLLLSISAGWCGPCNDFARYMSTGQGSYPNVKGAVDAGRINMIEYMGDDYTQDWVISDPGFLRSWHGMYPNDKVTVAEARKDFLVLFANNGSLAVPSFALISSDYKWETIGDQALVVAAGK